MLNKKNIAIAMAAATVAMPMTQSFAAVVESDQTQAVKDMKAKAFDLMNKEFTEDANLLINKEVAGQKIFKVFINKNTTEYTRYSDFERAFDTAYAKLQEGETLTVRYEYKNETSAGKDIGYNVLADGSIVDFEADKFTEKELNALSKGNDADDATKEVNVGEVQYKLDADDNSKTYQVRLTDADKHGVKRFADVKVGDAELDFSKPMLRQDEAKDYYVDRDGNSIASVEDGDIVLLNASGITITRADKTAVPASNAVVDGFYLATDNAKINAADSTIAADTYDAEAPAITSDVIKKGVQTTKLNASELFNINEDKVTANGNELLNRLQELTYDLNDIDYNIKITEVNAGQELKIVIEKQDRNDSHSTTMTKSEEIRIVRDAADKKGEAFGELKDLLLTSTFDTTGTYKNTDGTLKVADYTDKIAVAAGADRYATAAELSRKHFAKGSLDNTDEKAIVLVTGEQDKLVDGLTATPLAASLNRTDAKDPKTAIGAPVLLTGNSKLAQPVIDEMNRLNAKTVYIVGGAISESVEKELEDRYGMEVNRVSGDDRYDTALEVADELRDHVSAPFTNVFVAGGKSEADALSAGAAAARLKAPILLTNEDKLNKDVKYYLEGSKVDAKSMAYVVGGNISKSAYNDMLDVQDKDGITRLSGDTRQDTNAEVMEEFFVPGNPAKNAAATNVVVAKSDNKGMVDALGAGLYAGLNNAPVVLATNSLTEDQEDALDKITVNNDVKASRLLVGEGIASSVVNFIKDLKLAIK